MVASNQLISPIAQYLANFQRFYPGIMDWYAGLGCDFTNGRRKMFMVWNGSKILGLAISKNGYRAKLCHISVSYAARGQGIGSFLVKSALHEMIKAGAREIRVTTGEEVYRGHAAFFKTMGFKAVNWQVHRYRRNISEILWSLEIRSDLLRGVDNNRLPLRNDRSDFNICGRSGLYSFPHTFYSSSESNTVVLPFN